MVAVCMGDNHRTGGGIDVILAIITPVHNKPVRVQYIRICETGIETDGGIAFRDALIGYWINNWLLVGHSKGECLCTSCAIIIRHCDAHCILSVITVAVCMGDNHRTGGGIDVILAIIPPVHNKSVCVQYARVREADTETDSGIALRNTLIGYGISNRGLVCDSDGECPCIASAAIVPDRNTCCVLPIISGIGMAALNGADSRLNNVTGAISPIYHCGVQIAPAGICIGNTEANAGIPFGNGLVAYRLNNRLLIGQRYDEGDRINSAIIVRDCDGR